MVLTEPQQKAVLKVLQHVHTHGVHWTVGRSSIYTELPLWKRAFNWLADKLGAEREPFKDPANYCDIVRRDNLVSTGHLEEAMMKLAPTPKCRRCGSTNLAADPAGYYVDAQDWRGASLLCLDCDK